MKEEPALTDLCCGCALRDSFCGEQSAVAAHLKTLYESLYVLQEETQVFITGVTVFASQTRSILFC